MAYHIVFASGAERDIAALRAFDRAAIYAAIERFLSHQPEQVSRSRIKKLVQPAIAQYRLRVANFRVYYNIECGRVDVLHVVNKGGRMTEMRGVR
jgi:mRNA-degrading endonuclease RelE of RelBE toxin-antitoxin system